MVESPPPITRGFLLEELERSVKERRESSSEFGVPKFYDRETTLLGFVVARARIYQESVLVVGDTEGRFFISTYNGTGIARSEISKHTAEQLVGLGSTPEEVSEHVRVLRRGREFVLVPQVETAVRR